MSSQQDTGEALARLLAAALGAGATVAADPALLPATLDEAEAVQDRMLQLAGFRPAGWKLGASTHAAQAALRLTRAFLAPLPVERVLASPARLRTGQLRQPGVECELAVSLRGLDAAERHLLTGAPSASSLALTAELVTACHAAIEIPESRFPKLGAAGPLALVADNGAAGWVVVGAAGDASALRGPCRAALLVDGEEVSRGDATAFAAPPLHLVREFLHRAVQRRLLPDGPTVVSLGSVTPYRALGGAARVVAQFEGLPPATLTLTLDV